MHDARHLSNEELLLYSDGELAPSRAAHLEHCAACSAELSDLTGFLFRAEAELRASVGTTDSVPADVSWRPIERRIYAPEKNERRGFPVYWTAMYATAAALTFAVLGGFTTSLISFAPPAIDVAAALPGPVAPEPVRWEPVRLETPASATSIAGPEIAVVEPLVPAERFILARQRAELPSAAASLAVAPTLAAQQPELPSGLALVSPTVVAPAAVEPEPAEDKSAVAESYWQLARSGEWRQSITVSQAERAATPAEPLVARMGGLAGPVRSSLVAHYSDAARRSFRSPTPAVLEGEIQRFVSNVLDHQTVLLDHGYALRQALDAIGDTAALDTTGQQAVGKLIEFHTREMQQHEVALYRRLSETLPRRIWSYRGDTTPLSDGDVGAAGSQLMTTVSGLDRELTALLAGGNVTIDADTGARSAGAWLADLRTQIRGLRSRAKALR